MAKKFVKVNGLHNVFEASANIASSTIKSGAADSVDANSILFITADADDVKLFGVTYPSMKEGAHYIWAQGVLHDTNSGMLEVTVEGGDYLNTTGSQLGPGKAHIVVNHDESGVTAGTFGMAGASSVSAGGSIVVKIPNFTVDDYGHLTAANHSNLTIGVPAAETHKMSNHKALTLKVGGSSIVYGTTAATTVDIDAAIDKKMTTAVVYRGKATVDLVDGATTAASSLGITGYTTAKSGDLIISKDGIKEFMWNGSIWEEVGAENKSIVSYADTAKTGTTYEIGKITINGTTTTLIGRDNNTVTTVSYTDSSKTGTTYEIGKITINGTTTTLIGRDNDTKYTLPTASTSAIGGIKIAKDNSSYTVAAATSSISANVTSGKYYGVEIDKNDKAFVYVPWTNNHSFKSGTGIALSGTTTTSAGELTIGLKAATSSAIGGIAIGYPESGKNYPVELNSSGQAYVNVPWTNTTYGASGGVELNSSNNTFIAALHTWEKMGATGVASTSSSRYYRVGLDAAGKLAVNVPWTDTNTAHAHAAGDGIVLTGDTNGGTGTSTTTIGVTAATTAKYGGIKIGYAENGKNYPVELNSSGQAFVNVPWDAGQNTTYTLSGAVVGTTGSAAANSSVTTAVASAVSFVDTLKPSSGSATVSTCILMNGDGSINLKAVNGKKNAIEIDYTGVATAEDWATIG